MSKAVAEGAFRVAADALDFQTADHVRQRLARVRRCSGRSRRRFRPRRHRRVLAEVLHRLCAAPSPACIPVSTTSRAARQRVAGEYAEPVEGVGVEAHLVGQPLARRGPTPRRSAGPRVPAQRAAARPRAWAIATWKWCPGTASWKAVGSLSVPEALVGPVGVREVGALGGCRPWPRTGRDRPGRRGLGRPGPRLDGTRLRRHPPEPLRREGLGSADRRPGRRGEQFLPVAPAQRRVGA